MLTLFYHPVFEVVDDLSPETLRIPAEEMTHILKDEKPPRKYPAQCPCDISSYDCEYHNL